MQDVPINLLSESKFGLYKRILNSHEQIIDDFTDEEPGSKDIITIRLVVLDAHKFKSYKHFYVAVTRACKKLVIFSKEDVVRLS